MYLKHVITAGILSAALAIGPGAAFAQTSGSTSGGSGTSSQSGTGAEGTQGTTGTQGSSGSQGSTSQTPQSGTGTSSASGQSQAGSGGSGADQEAVRQHLSSAREALAELTKLPAASQLQGEQRQQVAQLIGDFNAFATATTDWRTKYDTIDRELDQILGLGATGTTGSMSGAASGSAAGAGASGTAGASTGTSADAGATGTAGASGTSGAAGASGGAPALDPTIIAKLQEVRKHLDGFEEASGDPTFVVEKIEKILDQAAGGAGGGAVGTSGTTGSTDASASGGSVTLTAAQVQELRRQLDSIKAAAKR